MTVIDVLPDDAVLRRARRDRLLAEMEAADIDLLVVGREANARYVSGAPRLWTAGSRAFGPGCVLVRATGAVHLLSTWDEGIPVEIPHENLYGISFNSTTFVTALRRVDGAAAARTVGTDGLTPSSFRLLPKAFPSAELVDAEPLLRRTRCVKLPAEVDAIRASVRVAEAALSAPWSALQPGITERQLAGLFMGVMAEAGVTTPASQDIAWVTSPEHPWRRANRDAPVRRGDLVAFDAGVILNGYVGELGRTRAVESEATGDESLRAKLRDLWDRLIDRCQVSAPLSGLLSAYDAAGVPPPPVPVARGLGLGFDLPLVTHILPASAGEDTFEAGMVFALTAYVWKEGRGALYIQEPVHLSATGPELLCTTPFHEERSS